MPSLEEIERIIKENRNILREKYFVNKIGIFGSYSKGEQTDESDLDIIVEFSQSIGWKFYALKDFLEELFGKEVDLATKNSLRDELKQDILESVIFV